MKRLEKEFVIKNPQGIHARPAALLVQLVSRYDSNVTLKKDAEEVNGKSIMGILMLGANQNSRITIVVEGEDSELVMQELEQLLNKEDLG